MVVTLKHVLGITSEIAVQLAPTHYVCVRYFTRLTSFSPAFKRNACNKPIELKCQVRPENRKNLECQVRKNLLLYLFYQNRPAKPKDGILSSRLCCPVRYDVPTL